MRRFRELVGGRPRSAVAPRGAAVTVAAALALAGAVVAGPLTPASAQPSPALSFNSTAVSFSVPVGAPGEHELTLTNSGGSGTGPMTMALLPAGSLFTISGETCPKSLGAGRSCTVTVQFDPTESVLDAGATLTVTSRWGASAAISLTGNGRDDGLPQTFYCDPDWDGTMERCFYGTADADTIKVDRFFDSYSWGYAGDDLLIGEYGRDTGRGGDGNDELDGKENDDTLYGEGGNDEIYGGANQDRLDGGSGNDTVSGNLNPDVLVGGDGTDAVYGGDGPDTLDDKAGDGLADTLDGGGGEDTCYVYDVGLDKVLHCEHVVNVG